MHRVRMLVHFGVTPYLIFDGDRLPSKAGTEKSRRDRRKEAREAGMELLRMGKTSQAHQELQKAVDITPEMARALIEELKRNNVQYVVAPYEADSQMAYLEKKGIIDAILSEDSDLLCFGARTLLTKLDQYGDCVMVKQDDFTACRDINLVGWTCDDFRRMCIFNGCDYLNSISKMGLKTAHRLLRKYKTVEKVIRFIQLEGKMKVPPGYAEAFIQAEKTFLYQWVYCPIAERMVNLTEPESEDVIAGLTYIGQYTEPEMARRLAAGDVNPITKQPIFISATPSSTYYKRTPLLSRSKTVDSSKHPKIDSFFKKRVPLAELNINNFTPSPSQQRVLANNANREWQADSVEPRPSSAPSRAAQVRPALLERTTSAPNLKRQRLCTEEEDAESSIAAETQRSKFFRTSTYQPSPLGARGTSKMKPNRHDFNLWSDDSIEDAMATLTDVSTPTQAVASDSAIKRIRKFEIHAGVNSEYTASTSTATDPAKPEVLEILDLSADSAPADPFASSLRTEAGSFKDRFSFTGLPTPPLTNTQSSAAPSSFMAEPATPAPLTQMQASDVIAKVEETPYTVEHDGVLKALPPRETSPIQTRKSGKETLMEVLSQQSTTARGSEDLMIVPDSEADIERDISEEDEREVAEEDEDSDTLPTFDLGRFAFSECVS